MSTPDDPYDTPAYRLRTTPVIPVIPVSPPTRTGPFRVELTPDGQAVRITTLIDGAVAVMPTAHDLDPLEARWLATMIRAHAIAIEMEQIAARELEGIDDATCKDKGFHVPGTRHTAADCGYPLEQS